MRLNVIAVLIAIAALSFTPLFAASGYIFDDFTIPTLSEDRNGNGVLDEGEDYNGNGVLDLPTDVSLFDYEGSIIIIDFFAYWCGPCINASPKIQEELYEYYMQSLGNPAGVQVEVWGVSMQGLTQSLPTEADIDAKTYEFLDKVPTVSYPMLMDYYRVAWDMTGSTSIPHMVVINGIPNDPVYQQWEVLFGESGYGGPDDIRMHVDSIAPSYDPLLNFSANQKTYFPGDTLSANLNVRYFGEKPVFDLYVALTAFGQLIFYPNWTKTPEASPLIMNPEFNEDFTILDRIPISKALPEGTYTLLSICADSGTLDPISDLAQLDFKVLHEGKGSMETYFTDNPVYTIEDQGVKKVPLEIFLENTGDVDITIDTFTIDTYDADGNYQGTQDASSDFPKWFKDISSGVLEVGQTTSANLQFGNSANLERQAQFYFHGIAANGGDVEVTSEKLIMLPMQTVQ
jgi:thiol-disulfide isomerase/thioredoxin